MTILISMAIAGAMAVAVISGQSTTPSGFQSPEDKTVCETMKPKDSPDFVRGSGTFVMKLRLVAKDKFIYVEIKGENKTTFEGFSIQAFDESGKVPLGKFRTDPKFKYLSCGNKNDSLVYESENKPKTLVLVRWYIPADLGKGKKILFKAGVTKNSKERYLLTQDIAVAV